MDGYREALGELLSRHPFEVSSKVRGIAISIFFGFPLLCAVVVATGGGRMEDPSDPFGYVGMALVFIALPAAGVVLWRQAKMRQHDEVRVYREALWRSWR